MTNLRPNVVLVVLDTARAQTVRSGFKQDYFPELRRLAKRGVDVENAYTSAPWTLPSHAGLFTSLYSSKHGAHAGHKRLNEDPMTLAEAFTTAGYETAAVSNNTWISEEFGFTRGFDQFRKNWQYIQSDTDLGGVARTAEGRKKLTGFLRHLFDGKPLINVTNAIYGQFIRNRAADDGAASTNEWVRTWLCDRTSTAPFFLFLNYLEPHLEYRPPKGVAAQHLPAGISYSNSMEVSQDAWGYIAGKVEMSDHDFEVLQALYRAEIAYLDEQIGVLRSILEAAGEWDDTVFVVVGDHGENIGDHGLMDHQYCLYETLIHVPLILSGGAISRSERLTETVQLTDIGPTLLDEAGIDAPEYRSQAQGFSFHPTADSPGREFVIAEYLAPQPSLDALRDRVGELDDSVERYDRALRTIRTDEWKLIRGSDGTVELYDTGDEGEKSDESANEPDVVQTLSDKLDMWLDSFTHAEMDTEVTMSARTKARLEDLGYL